MTFGERFGRFCDSPRLPLWLALASALLVSPSLFAGLATEDYVFRSATAGPFSISNVNLYGGPPVPGIVDLMKRAGVVPWLGSPELHLSFWRPLASLTHQLDYRLLGGLVPLMHLESIFFHALGVWLAAKLYLRVFQPRRVAAIAALFFAVDDAHGHAVGWLANRNSVLALCLGLGALLAHDRLRRDGWKPGLVVAPLLFGLALLSSELALGALGYFLAYALFFERRSLGGRLLALAPVGLVTAAWAVAYRALGHGARGSGLYLDPLRAPLDLARALPDRLGTLWLGQLAAPPADVWNELGDGTRPLLAVGGALVLAAVVVALRRHIARDRALGFALAGALGALGVACTTFPSDRVLAFGGFGAFALVAALVVEARGALRPLAWALLAIHGVLAPILLPLRTLTMAAYHVRLMRLADSAYGAVTSPDQTLVVVNAPNYYACSLLRLLELHARERNVQPVFCLAGTPKPIELARLDANALEVRVPGGFLERPFNQLYRSRREPMHVGDSSLIGSTEARVSAVATDGEPTAASFRFSWPLDSDKIVFVALRDGRYARLEPPRVGETRVISE